MQSIVYSEYAKTHSDRLSKWAFAKVSLWKLNSPDRFFSSMGPVTSRKNASAFIDTNKFFVHCLHPCETCLQTASKVAKVEADDRIAACCLRLHNFSSHVIYLLLSVYKN